jgi:hypothetical protein
MEQSDAELTVARRLGQLLDRGLLPAGGPAEAAERLIERLERPARIALLGLPGAGKSAILNLLTGTIVIPETLRLPTIIVQHGSVPRMTCTLTDGRTEVVPGADLNDVLALNPALVTLEMDLPALKVISLLEVSAGPMEAEQRRAAIWASKRADILIWCTTSYLPKEQQVWEGMPDVVKDNGFLFLTKVDLLGSREAAAGMLERVEMRAGEEFRQILAISAKQAREAMPPGEPVNRDMFRDSGATAVISTIKSRVQAARRADTDMAELLLARHVEAGGIVARRFAEPDETPAASGWAPPPEVPAPSGPVAETVVAKEMPVPVAEPAARPEARPEPSPEPEPEIVARAPEPVRATEPDPEPQAPTPRPPVMRAPDPEPDLPAAGGRKRFSDRIKQMPVPEDAPAVPLRSTWKSRAETGAAKAPEAGASEPATPRPEPREVVEDSRQPRAEPRPRAVPEKEPEPQDDDVTLSRMLASVAEPTPDVSESEAEPDEEDLAAEEEQVDDIDADDLAAVEDESPRWAERLKPAEVSPPADRTPRTSLFGTRKPVVAAPPAAGARPQDRVARPTEPVTRVRAPAPRPAEPPRPAALTPGDLATPRIVPMREMPQAATEAAQSPRAERRERPRIARVLPPAPVETVAAAPATVPSAEMDLLDEAIERIMARSADLAGSVDPDEKIPVDAILDHSRETVEQVLAVLGGARSAGLRRVVADLGEIQDIIMLMQLEKGHAPADDALTLLLQIRRDLETLRSV